MTHGLDAGRAPAEHKEELVRNWDLARLGLPHEPIDLTIEEEA